MSDVIFSISNHRLQAEAARLCELFAGNEHSHVEGFGPPTPKEDNPLKWKITYTHVDSPATPDLWHRHLMGECMLTVCPLLDDGTCWWAAIDYDEYEIDYIYFCELIDRKKLPLKAVRSKSGGIHFLVFFSEPISAKLVRIVLRYWAQELGLKKYELFPSRDTTKPDENSHALNMPYGPQWEVMPEQCAMNVRGGAQDLGHFLLIAEGMRLAAKDLPQEAAKEAKKDERLRAEPPSVEFIKAALNAIPSDDYNNWMNIGAALYNELGDEAYEYFKEWSKKSTDKYDEKMFEDKWQEVKKYRGEVTAGTIFWHADQEDPGWRKRYEVEHGVVSLADFFAYMPKENFMHIPTLQFWPAKNVDVHISAIKIGKKRVQASTWLIKNSPVNLTTWAPGEPTFIRDKFVHEGGWIEKKGVVCFNWYVPPTIELGDPRKAGPWLRHVFKLYGSRDGKHIIRWLAFKVQHPEEKINHALVLGGRVQGTGKDTLLAPVRYAVGPWNFGDYGPQEIMGTYQGFLKKVILRINEARDFGESNRYKFYDHTKAYNASPPEGLPVNEKYIGGYHVLNRVNLIITSNYLNSMYLPTEDRRHYVAWTDCTLEDFGEDLGQAYFRRMWKWYYDGGFGHVAAFLHEINLAKFDPKEPPPKTAAFWEIADAGRSQEEIEIQDVLDQLYNPIVVTKHQLKQVAMKFASHEFIHWLTNRKNNLLISRCLERLDYHRVENPDTKDKMWKFPDGRQMIYGKKDAGDEEKLVAARKLVGATANR